MAPAKTSKRLKPTPPPAASKGDAVAKAKKAQKKNVLDEILDAFPAEAKVAPTAPGAVPVGFAVTSVHESEPRYKSEGRWLVVTRRNDLVVGHRFKTEDEARAFAATAVSA